MISLYFLLSFILFLSVSDSILVSASARFSPSTDQFHIPSRLVHDYESHSEIAANIQSKSIKTGLIKDSSSSSISYIFPTRYEFSANGYLQNSLMNNLETGLLAYGYVDYTIGGFISTELWNRTAIYSTPYQQLYGIDLIDTRLEVNGKSAFYWTNQTGNYCQPSQSGHLVSQTLFSSDTYQGIELYEGIQCYVFNASVSISPGSYAVLYVNSMNNIPVAQYGVFIFGSQIARALQQYINFREVEEFPKSIPIFNFPSFCAAEGFNN